MITVLFFGSDRAGGWPHKPLSAGFEKWDDGPLGRHALGSGLLGPNLNQITCGKALWLELRRNKKPYTKNKGSKGQICPFLGPFERSSAFAPKTQKGGVAVLGFERLSEALRSPQRFDCPRAPHPPPTHPPKARHTHLIVLTGPIVVPLGGVTVHGPPQDGLRGAQRQPGEAASGLDTFLGPHTCHPLHPARPLATLTPSKALLDDL